MLAALIGNPFLFKVFDLSSVDKIYVGAGILSTDLYAKVKEAQPSWNIIIGYGNQGSLAYPSDKQGADQEYFSRPD